jgi:putative FmdB family regulatory protein
MPPGLEHFYHANYFLLMPIYEFHCEECERGSEILVRSTNWKDSACPHCGSKKLSKKFSTFASAGTGNPTSGKSSGGGRGCGDACHCH